MESTALSLNGTVANSAAASSASTNRQLSSDFEVFLTMLTAQLENQDPLNPVDSTDYATQLATFSGVEQQVKTNDLLKALGQQFGEIGLSQLASWVGMEARVDAPAYFDGTPMTLYPQYAASADNAVLVAHNSLGQEVSRQQLPLDGQPLTWAGTDDFGTLLSPDVYTFSVENYLNGELVDASPVETYALVSEAKISNGQTIVVLPGGVEVPTSGISALRAATN